MSRPSIWYYPVSGGACEELTLGWSIQELARIETYERSSPRNGIGAPTHYGLLGRTRVRVYKERVDISTNPTLVRGLRAVENHLLRGGTIGVAADRSKAFAAYVTTGLYAGGTTIEGNGNTYADLLSESLTLAAGDAICLESGNPNYRREDLVISSVTVGPASHSITTTTPIRFDRDAGAGVMVRHRDFYPALYLPDDQVNKPILTSEHGALWSFEAELEVVESLYGMDPGLQFDLGDMAEMGPRDAEMTFDVMTGKAEALTPPNGVFGGRQGRTTIVLPPAGGWVPGS